MSKPAHRQRSKGSPIVILLAPLLRASFFMNTYVTICPPGAANTLPPEPQFLRIPFPVEAKFVGYRNTKDGSGFESTGIGFDDLSRMSTGKKKTINRERRKAIPAFMQEPQRFRTVIIRYLERRVGLYRRQLGTLEERLQRVQVILKTRAELCDRRMDAACAEYVSICGGTKAPVELMPLTAAEEVKAPRRDLGRLATLQKNITQMDSEIRILREPSILPGICKAYYAEHLDSPDIAERFGITAVCVRQILHRMNELDESIQNGTDFRVYKEKQ